METKICSKCSRELPINMFEKGRGQCKLCRNDYKRNEYNLKKTQYNVYASNRQKRCENHGRSREKSLQSAAKADIIKIAPPL